MISAIRHIYSAAYLSPYALYVVLFLLFLAALQSSRLRVSLWGLWNTLWKRPLVLFAVALAAYLSVAGYYLSRDYLISTVETQVASVSWIYEFRGAELYQSPEGSGCYSLMYGPLLYAFFGKILRAAGPYILALKAAATAATLAWLAFCFLSFRARAGQRAALLLMALLFTYVFSSDLVLTTSMNIRPEPLLAALAGLALFAAATVRLPSLAWVLMGAAMGIAVNIKIHSPLYFLPLLVLLGGRFGLSSALKASALATALAILPFALSQEQISLSNYITWLRIAGKHGVDTRTLADNLFWLSLYFLPLAIHMLVRGRPSKPLMRFLVATLACSVPAAIVGAKSGSGPYHIIPYAPLLLYAFAWHRGEVEGGAHSETPRPLAAALAFAGLATVLLLSAATFYWIIGGSLSRLGVLTASEVRAEYEVVKKAYPGRTISFGFGGDKFREVMARFVTVFDGQPYMLDLNSVTDSQYAGMELPEGMIDSLRKCTVGVWMLPKGGEPFYKHNAHYDQRKYDQSGNKIPTRETNIFPRRFQEAFAASHRLERSTAHFDVWVCQPAPAPAK